MTAPLVHNVHVPTLSTGKVGLLTRSSALVRSSHQAQAVDTVHIHAIYRDMMDDFTLCMVSNTRKAARAITRRYDAHARPFGITSTQFSLMGTLQVAGGQTVSQLAEERGFERTTLTRNLDRLEKMGLVASRTAEQGNGRLCTVTEQGQALLDRMVPVWRKAQAEIRADLGADEFDRTIATLKRLAAV
ncbi:MAG: MarR family transcriptional regulator [Burkholderiales bacterium]|nr:MAG: MarR family transcriptional regulator [Burkholderiales bacterium]